MKINKPLEKVLMEIEETEPTFLEMDPQALLAHKLEEAQKPPDDPYDLDAALRAGLYADCTEEQWCLYKFKFPDLLGLNAAAAYRRIRYNAPLEYAMLMALCARAEWIEAKINWKYNREELWRPLLLAAATHDRLATERLMTLWEQRTGKPDNPALVPITLGIEALSKRDASQLHSATEHFHRSVNSYLKGIQTALGGLAANDPMAFMEGINQMLNRFKDYMFGEKTAALIDPLAHGLFELAQLYSPECVEQFDETQKFPWDAEYRQWIRSIDDLSVELPKLLMPEFLRRALIDMEDMDWAPDNRPKA